MGLRLSGEVAGCRGGRGGVTCGNKGEERSGKSALIRRHYDVITGCARTDAHLARTVLSSSTRHLHVTLKSLRRIDTTTSDCIPLPPPPAMPYLPPQGTCCPHPFLTFTTQVWTVLMYRCAYHIPEGQCDV